MENLTMHGFLKDLNYDLFGNLGNRRDKIIKSCTSKIQRFLNFLSKKNLELYKIPLLSQ
jgi:hypothetical protein